MEKLLTAKQYLDLFNDDIIKNCQPYVEGLNKQDAEKHLLTLAAKSLGIKPEAEIKCSCGKHVTSEITHLHTVQEDLFYDFDNVKIQFKYPNINLPEDAIEQFLECIDFIVMHDMKTEWKDVTEDQLNHISEYFTFEFMQSVLKKLNADIYTVVEFNCECGETASKTITGFNKLIEYYKV